MWHEITYPFLYVVIAVVADFLLSNSASTI